MLPLVRTSCACLPLALVVTHFSALVANPVDTLVYRLGPLIFMIIFGCSIWSDPSLSGPLSPPQSPPSPSRATPQSSSVTGRRSRTVGGRTREQSSTPRSAAEKASGALLWLTLGIPSTHTLAILMGAPATTHVSETVLLSFIVSVLGVLPVFMRIGRDGRAWSELLAPLRSSNLSRSPPPSSVSSSRDDALAEMLDVSRDKTRRDERETKGDNDKEGRDDERGEETSILASTMESHSTQSRVRGLHGQFYGSFVGAYVGAIPIPLDWDRDWQAWPVTVVIGTCLGAAVGAVLDLAYVYYYSDGAINPKAIATKNGKRLKLR